MKDDGIPTANAFAEQIETMVWEKDITYMDAIVLWCDVRGLEPETAAALVKKSQPLKLKIQNEAEELNFLPKSGSKLPI